MKDYIPERVCGIPLQARTEFTPRSDPTNTGILNIVNPASDGFVPSLSEKMAYEGPDVLNPALLLPKDVIDVCAIVSNRRLMMEHNMEFVQPNKVHKNASIRRRMNIETGKGWELETLPGTCDGTTTAICGRESTSDCLLYGHMDHKGGLLVGGSDNGWLSMKLSNMTQGIIMLKFELVSEETELHESISADSLQDDFNFEYAIDGDITSLSKKELFSKKKSPEPKVDNSHIDG